MRARAAPLAAPTPGAARRERWTRPEGFFVAPPRVPCAKLLVERLTGRGGTDILPGLCGERCRRQNLEPRELAHRPRVG